ncbi:MAG: HAMP domain-containing protein [Rubrivivax sp.]|nr:MAG: HAMP domain-containing protein [Rubrivivax sp.]
MSWFANLRLRAKLMLSFAVVLTMTLLLGVFAVLKLAAVNEQSTEVVHNWMPSIQAVSAHSVGVADLRLSDFQLVSAGDEAESQQAVKDMAQASDELKKSEAMYVKLISSPAEKALWEAFKQDWGAYLVEHQEIVKLVKADQLDAAKSRLLGRSQQLFVQANDKLDQLVLMNVKGGNEAGQQVDGIYNSARWAILVVVVLAMVLGMAMAMYVAQSISKPVRDTAQVLQAVAEGDLTQTLHSDRQDEIGLMQRALSQMVDSFAGTVSKVRAGAESVATASAEIAHGNLDLSSRTENQASSLEQTAASVEQMSGTVRTNADNARQANQLASAASEVAMRGGEVVSQVVNTMSGIQAASKKIADIIGVIDGIAFQTNILALNAAVEAARAGEQGRGFAVVAGEVRSLAQRSAQAAREIKTLISDSVEQVNAGSDLVSAAGTTMNDVVMQVRKVTDLVGEIAHASTEQSQGIAQINQAIGQLDQATQQNAALVEESTAAAESLSTQAQSLAQSVAAFKTRPSMTSVTGALAVPVTVPLSAPAMHQHGAPAKPSATVLAKTAVVSKAMAPKAKTPAPATTPSEPVLAKATAPAHADDWETF